MCNVWCELRLPINNTTLPVTKRVLARTMMLRPMRKLILRHPGKLTAWLVAFSSMYTYARVLTLQYAVGALQHWILQYPGNFPHAFFLPLYYGSLAAAFVAALAHDLLAGVADVSGLWKYALPLPLTVAGGRLGRVAGVPVYALALASLEAVQRFRDPSIESDLSRLAAYFQALHDPADDLLLQRLLAEVKRRAWSLPPASPSTAAYVRLPLELLCALLVCGIYSIAIFCNEPRHDGEELREATRNNDVVRVKRILARGANPNTRSDDGATPLHICAQQALVSPAKVLLENKADPNVADRLGFTALHWAVQIRREEISASNRLEMIRLLVRNGANPLQADPSGVTPLSIASKRENVSSLEVLRESMGTGDDGEEKEEEGAADASERRADADGDDTGDGDTSSAAS